MQTKDDLKVFSQEVDNILQDNTKKKKKVNSGDKGHRAERELCKKFTERFGLPFDRSAGSGNSWSYRKGMSEGAKVTLLGDISVPDNFRWVIESKSGYEDKVDLHGCFVGGNKTIDDFLDQVSDDAKRSGRKPLLVYKRKNRPWVAFLRKCDRPYQAGPHGCLAVNFDYQLAYRDWIAMSLDGLLGIPDLRSPDNMDFWFNQP